ncbi:MAG: BatA domain-containing protein, partial [Planctomycetota bacterium]|nr:BatA domain-containing protein [Planctomycetota bacterium]
MITPAAITGLAPIWIILGAAAIAAPIIAHLFARRRAAAVLFPAVRFVQAALAERRRRVRFREALLLALRLSIVALIALAFSQPRWTATEATAADASLGVDHIFIIDASASMSRPRNGRTLFDLARDVVRESLDKIDPAVDRAASIIAAAAPRSIPPEPTAELPLLRAELAAAEHTLEHADLTAAIRLAAAAPSPTRALRHKRINLLTDLQRSQWSAIDRIAPPPGATIEILPIVAPAEHTNRALADPALSPPHAAPGQPADIAL